MSDVNRQRCSWATAAAEYVAYHDDEWGSVLHGEHALFERLSLEGFQSGLSWLIILRKREGFRHAFADFDIDRVAAFTAKRVDKLMTDAAIVRNRAKIEATIGNARAIRDSIDDFDELLWSFAPSKPVPYEVRATSAESVAMSKALKGHGLRFVGPTTCYSLMQAVGMVNDHQPGCFRAPRRRAASTIAR
jgi:DNA-3-methyladenine glycosylase I